MIIIALFASFMKHTAGRKERKGRSGRSRKKNTGRKTREIVCMCDRFTLKCTIFPL